MTNMRYDFKMQQMIKQTTQRINAATTSYAQSYHIAELKMQYPNI